MAQPRASTEDLEQRLFPSDARRDEAGRLTIGGADVVSLAEEHDPALRHQRG